MAYTKQQVLEAIVIAETNGDYEDAEVLAKIYKDEFNPTIPQQIGRAFSEGVSAVTGALDRVVDPEKIETKNPADDIAAVRKYFVQSPGTDNAIIAAQKEVGLVPTRMKQTIAGGLQYLEEAAKTPMNPESEAGMNIIGQQRASDGRPFTFSSGQTMYNEAQAEINAKQPVVKPGTFAAHVAGSVASAGQMLPAMAIGALTGQPEVTLAIIGAQSKAQNYGDSRASGLSPAMAELYSSGMAAAEVIGEKTPVGVFLASGGGYFKRLAKGTAAETIGEEVTEAMQIALDKGFIQPDMTMQQASQRLVDSGVISVMSSPGYAAIGEAGDYARRTMRAKAISDAIDKAVSSTTPNVVQRVQRPQPIVQQGQPIQRPANLSMGQLVKQKLAEKRKAETNPAAAQASPSTSNVAAAIVQQESGGNTNAVNRKSGATGIYQITPLFLADGNRFLGTSYTMQDMKDPAKASAITQAWHDHYSQQFYRDNGRMPTEREIAMMHHGGPKGYLRTDAADQEGVTNAEYADQVMRRMDQSDGNAVTASEVIPDQQTEAEPTAEEPPIPQEPKQQIEPPPAKPSAVQELENATMGSSRSSTPVKNGESVISFVTAKGSNYTVHEDGTTTRTKTKRDQLGHEGDFGVKSRSARTIYVDKDRASGLSGAGLIDLGPHGFRVALRPEDGTAWGMTWNEKEDRWGASPSGWAVPFTDTPEIGKAPVELWGPKSDVPGRESYSGQHAGNAIISIKSKEKTLVANAPAKPPVPLSESKPFAETDKTDTSDFRVRDHMINEQVRKAAQFKTVKDVQLSGIDKKTNGKAIGDFMFFKEGKGYNVTHIPTGLAVQKDLHPDDARELVYRLSMMENKLTKETGDRSAFLNEGGQILRDFADRKLLDGHPVPVLGDEQESSKTGDKEKEKATTTEPPEWWNKITDSERYNRLVSIGHRPSTIRRDTWFELTDKQREALDYQWGNAGKHKETQIAQSPENESASKESIAQEYADLLGQQLGDYHRDIARAILEKDAERLEPIIGQAKGANKNTEKIFTKYTGVKLPSRIADRKQAIKEWAESPELSEQQEPETTPVEEKRPSKQSDELQRTIETRLIARLIDSGFKSISDARRWYKDEVGIDIEPGTSTAKYFDELVEVALVKAARKIVEKGSFDDNYEKLVALYDNMPRLGVRTSESVAQQAYSTPLPLAYAASRLAGIGSLTKVYEPTAGNGVLLIEASPKNAVVNELNPDRAEALKKQGFAVTEHDASQYVPDKMADVVIANPPFGVVKDERGRSKEFEVSDVYSTKEIDHAIALKALDAMSDDGKAVLILGAVKAESEEALSDGYNGKAKREFYIWLHQHYNVVDHFIVSGDLYQKQGAGWPVDVITIHGRGRSALKVPAANVPDIVNDWKSLKERVKDYVTAEDTVGATGERIRRSRGTGDNARAEKPAEGAGRGVSEQSNGVGSRSSNTKRVGAGQTNVAPDERSMDAVKPAQKTGRKQAEPAPKRSENLRRSSGGSRSIKEGKSQAAYKPASKAKSVSTLLPVNMANGVEIALANVIDQHGDIDKWVAGELGYREGEIGNYLSAEQIDAVALAIHNMQKGAAFIIGDQTGIGKGRFVASILRWALKKNHVPVFITEKPDLYADMYRDLSDTGIQEMLGREPRILATNSGLNISLVEGKSAIKTASGKAHDDELLKFLHKKIAGDDTGYDMVFTTYSQLQTVKGEDTARRRVIESLAPVSVFLVDESHNAGGNQKLGFNGEKVVDDVPDRAQLVRNITRKAVGTVFSSATYAKRPEVMDLYASTDLGLAVDDIEKLPEVIGRGGVPMQQIIASMLAESGQYLRRERSFDGIDYEVVKVPVDRKQYDTVANIMGWINAFSQQVAVAAKGISKELKAEGRAMSGNQSTGGAGVDSTNFTSVMHNVIGQMLFAIKADAAADMAIADLKAGMKPVITVAGTLESFHKEIVDSLGLNEGDQVDIGFGDLLLRYLEKCRWVTERRPFMKKGDVAEKKRLTDQQLGPMAVSLEKKIMQIVQASDFSNMPISPIDWIRHRISEAGYKVTEITGRQSIMLYDKEKNAFLGKRPLAERGVKGKERTKAGFNNGDIDAVILNQSGSTGISLHASETFKDQRKRIMTIAQAEGNIDTHMQMLGRVNRTGQVVLPGFRQLNADIPAENRPAAVLAKKMASLNANTTGSTKSRFTNDDVPDIINIYGDEAAYELLLENPKLLARLGNDLLKIDEDSDKPVMADIARRMTGRVPMLPLKEQEEVYEQLIDKFNSILSEANARGENALEAQTMKLDAEVLETKQIQAQTGDSPFQGAVYLEKLRVNNLSKPFTSEEVMKQVEEATGVKPEGEPWEALELMRKKAPKEFIKESLEAFKAYRINELQDIETPEARDKAMTRLENVENRWRRIIGNHGVGSPVELVDGSGFLYRGIVTEIKQTGKPQNPLALSTWKMKVSVASSTRQLTIQFSKLFPPGTSLDDKSFSIREVGLVDGLHVIDMFDALKNTDKETRYMLTGNIPAGYGIVGQGAIVNYTTAEGEVKQGILMKRGYKFESSNDVAFITGAQVIEYLNLGGVMRSSDDAIKAVKNGAVVRIEIKGSKQAGGKYFLDKSLIGITGDFVSVGGMMRADVSEVAAAKAFDRMRSLGAKLRPDGKIDVARKIVGGEAVATNGVLGMPSRRSPVLQMKRKVKSIIAPDEIVRAIERMTGTPVQVGKGYFGVRRMDSWFNPKNDLIRVKQANALDKIAHEAGHSVHAKILQWFSEYPSTVMKELVAIGVELYGDKKPNGGYHREGFAEFFAKKIMGKDVSEYQTTNAWFESQVLDKRPDLKTSFDATAALFEQWESQGAYGRIAGMVHRVAPGIKGKALTAWEKLSKSFSRRMWINDAAPLERVVDDLIKRTDVELRPTENPAMMRAALKMSAQGTARRFILDHAVNRSGDIVGKSLVDYLRPVKNQLEEFTVYALSRRALDLHRRGIDPGISKSDAEYSVETLQSKEFDDALFGITEWSNYLIDYVVECGGMSPDAAKAMRDLNPIYLPLKRYFDETHMGGARGIGSKFSSGIKRIKGSGRRIIDPVDSFMQQAEQMIRFGNEMMVVNSIASAVEKVEQAGKDRGEILSVGWFANKVQAPVNVDEFSVADIARQLEEIGVDLADADMEQVLRVFSSAQRYTGKQNIITIIRNGKREFWEIDPAIYEVIMEMDKDHLPAFFSFFIPAKRLVQLGAVGVNASFGVIKNPIRDTIDRAVYGQRRSHPFDTLANGFFEELKQGRYSGLWKNLGGELSTLMGQDRIATQRLLEEGMAETKKEKVIQVFKHPIDAFRSLLSFYESAPRIAEFRAVLEKSEEKYGTGSLDARIEALLASKDVTVNFTRAGIISQALNGIIPFFNAAIQGSSKFVRSFDFRKDGKAAARSFGAAISYITVPSLLLFMLNKDEDWYEELTKYERLAYWHFSPDGGGTIFRIPKPFQLGFVFGSVPEAVFYAAYKDNPELVNEALLETAKGFLPADSVFDLLPALIKPSVEVAANYDSFRENPIVPYYEEKGKIPKDQYGKGTTEMAKAIGSVIGVSPRKVEHILSNQTGGLALNSIRNAEAIFGVRKLGRNDQLADIPIIGTLFSRNPYYSGRTVNKVYELKAQLEQKAGSGNITPKERYLLKKLDFAAKKMKLIRKRLDADEISYDEAAIKLTNAARMAFGMSMVEKK
jgi:hypothetical protein